MPTDRALVVGAGVGGLSTAIYLSLEGYRVTVFESNESCGGRANLLEFEGFRFDTGPSLLNYPWVFDEMFRAAGSSLRQELQLNRVDPAIKFFWPDGETFQVSSDLTRLASECRRLDSGDTAGLFSFLHDARNKFSLSFDRLVSRNANSPLSWFAAAGLTNLPRLGLLRSMDSEIGRHFKNKRIRDAFGSYGMYLGGAPTDLPGIFSIIPFGEIEYGLWLPKGGMYSLIQAMQGTAERLGVEIVTGCPVKNIDTDSDRVTGITLQDGSFEPSQVVVSNVDVPTTMTRLVGASDIKRYRAPQMTPGVLTYYLAVDRELPELGHHSVFLPDDPGHAYRQLMKKGVIPDDLPFYVSVASNTDPGMAPKGKSAVFILVPVPLVSQTGHVNWQDESARLLERVQARLKVHRITIADSDIIQQQTMTPIDWSDQFGLYDGSAFGASHNLRQIGPFRPKNFSPRFKGLFFTGASTTPGTGVPMCVLSGKMAADRVVKWLRKEMVA